MAVILHSDFKTHTIFMEKKTEFLGYKEIKPFPKVPFWNTEKDSHLVLKGDDRALMRKIIEFHNDLFRPKRVK